MMVQLSPLFAQHVSRRLLLTFSILGIAALAGFASLLMLAVTKTDRATLLHQQSLVEHGLEEQVVNISRDQESVVFWDDAALKAAARDNVWLHENLGAWMFDYFGHDRTLVVSPANDIVYAMVGGQEQLPSAALPLLNRLDNDLASLRRQIAVATGKEPVARRRMLVIDHRPAIASMMPIVPHSDRVSVDPGQENILVSLQYFDRALIHKLRDEYQLAGARISLSDTLADGETSVPIRLDDGRILAHLMWRPNLPGESILTAILPAGLAGTTLLVFLIVLLTQRIYRTLTALEASEKRATHVALHDPLTGLPNRAHIIQKIDADLSRADPPRTALLLVDLDRFKEVNDTLGHAAGDELIKIFASRASLHLRRSDCIGRLGGDEFAVLLTEVQTDPEISSFCDRLLESAARPFEVAAANASVGASIGIAMAEAGLDRDELLRRADVALYAAKRNGRHCYRTYTPDLDSSIREQRLLEGELRAAIDGQPTGLELHYQPLMDNRTNTIRGVEALLRWEHPRLGSIMPSVFLPVAETSGLIRRLDEWVLRYAFRDATRWPLLTLAVNLSTKSFQREGLTGRVAAIAADEGFDLTRLEIEVKERVLLDSAGVSGEEIQALRKLGVRITLDDFGSGYAGLRELERLRVDKVKIGRSFVQHLGQTVDSTAMVRAMTEMGHALGLAVAAQGVETESQREFLRTVGCDSFQGHLVAKALPAWGITARFGEKDRNIA